MIGLRALPGSPRTGWVWPFLCLLPAGCQQGKLPQPDLSGTIMHVIPMPQDGKSRQAGSLAYVHIDVDAADPSGLERVAVLITTKTKVAKLVGESRQGCRWDELKEGSKVQVLFSGPVQKAASRPTVAMASGKELLVVEEP